MILRLIENRRSLLGAVVHELVVALCPLGDVLSSYEEKVLDLSEIL